MAVLGLPYFSKGFILETYDSLMELGNVLSQEAMMESWVITYARRMCSPSEQSIYNYRSVMVECLALKWIVAKKLCSYLLG